MKTPKFPHLAYAIYEISLKNNKSWNYFDTEKYILIWNLKKIKEILTRF